MRRESFVFIFENNPPTAHAPVSARSLLKVFMLEDVSIETKTKTFLNFVFRLLMNTSLLDSAPEPDSGYLSPPMTDEGTAEEQFSFESDVEPTIFSKRSPRVSKYNKPETTGSLDLDMSRSTVYQRRRRSFSDPFPRKVSNIVANQPVSLNHAHSCYECIASTVCSGMQTCLSFPAHAFCRCAGCSSTSGSG